MKTAFVYSPEYRRYDFGPDHPFQCVRVDLARTLLEACGCLDAADIVPPLELTEDELLRTHRAGFVERVRRASRGEAVPDATDYGLGTLDVPVFAGMHEAALQLVGGTARAAQLILDGDYRRAVNLGGGLHHAQADKAAGFCVYNDLSVAARRFTQAGWRVAYLDVDVHHGDGVQWLHYEDPRVLTLSLHETGRFLWPGTGATWEMGRGEGSGYSLNLPLEPFTQDDSYLEVLERVVPAALAWFRPDVLILQAGADAHFKDPLADLSLTVQGLRAVYRRVSAWADEFASGRLLATGGGGYAIHNVAPRAWALLYAELSGQSVPEELPPAWLQAWQAPQGDPLPSGWWDLPPEIPRRAEIESRNRRVAQRLLTDWAAVRK
ncbi:acetoin utilization protein AcuC [Deinobacterium chartae]|uniref:Acetoin utilization protein AcuC n=1 Tax=Deinobacterium chartae TaxID=521158 RepID=A0A841I324_9DEIO|nr:acetoin utilization protein AcuC [Deinobacterium chartae]MBB6099424.1 acetoin utilization protein AcuC [Deinobacterium chartae]